MKNVARALLTVVGLFILGTGLTALLAPDRIATKMAWELQGAEGLSNLRAFLGASLSAIGISVLIAAVTAQIYHARPAALFLIGLVVARIFSFLMDGPISRLAAYIAIPCVVLAILLVAHRLLDRASAQTAPKT